MVPGTLNRPGLIWVDPRNAPAKAGSGYEFPASNDAVPSCMVTGEDRRRRQRADYRVDAELGDDERIDTADKRAAPQRNQDRHGWIEVSGGLESADQADRERHVGRH